MTIALDVPRRRRSSFFGGRLPATFIAGATILTLSLLLAIAPQIVSPYDPLVFDYKAILKPPGLAHPFGTDSFGRDVLSRVISAYRIDLQIAVFSTIPAFIFGTLVGALIIAVLSNGLILMNVSEVWQLIIKGLVIVGAVALDRYRNKGSART